MKAYNGAGHDECPPTGSGIGLDSLEHRHVMFELLGLDGARSVVIDLLIVDSFALEVGLRLDLGRHGLLCGDVTHVDDFCEKRGKR